MPNDEISDEDLADLADVVMELSRWLVRRPDGTLEASPLNGTEIAVIREVTRTPLISPSGLAEATGLKSSNVSSAIRSLEGRGLLKRQQTIGDERGVQLEANALAIENFEQVRAEWAKRLRRAPRRLLEEGARVSATMRDLGR